MGEEGGPLKEINPKKLSLMSHNRIMSEIQEGGNFLTYPISSDTKINSFEKVIKNPKGLPRKFT